MYHIRNYQEKDRKQAINPYLPQGVCIPDGEPHVFGDRVYIYGSHDKEGGIQFCELDYEVYSAPVTNLSDWSSRGTSYRASQDPAFSEMFSRMFAPDVTKGNDGRYYLYYAMSGSCFTGPIHVAVSDNPQGPFAYHGCVRNSDGTDYKRNVTFDPAVLNDNGTIRLYYGWALDFPEEALENRGSDFEEQVIQTEMMLFGKTREEIEACPEGVMGAYMVELEEDMLTVKNGPVKIVPGNHEAPGTSFENHAFFEGSSIRKIGDVYYFIYSSQWQHELCYAISKSPDKDFVYGGVIISNGDIGYKGRKPKDRLAMTGNNHGSIEHINGRWYVFYHRQTHKNSYSRQGCAERIHFTEDGHIPQVEMTSCGLNGGPLKAEGTYPAYIACNLAKGNMPHVGREEITEILPYQTHDADGHYITDITDGTVIGFKYFEFHGKTKIQIRTRGTGEGVFGISAGNESVGEIHVMPGEDWITSETCIDTKGKKALYFKYAGGGKAELIDFSFVGEDFMQAFGCIR